MEKIAVSNMIGRSCVPKEAARAKTERKASEKKADPHLDDLKNEKVALEIVTIGQWMETLNAMLAGYVERCGTVCTLQTRLERTHVAAHQVERRTVLFA